MGCQCTKSNTADSNMNMNKEDINTENNIDIHNNNDYIEETAVGLAREGNKNYNNNSNNNSNSNYDINNQQGSTNTEVLNNSKISYTKKLKKNNKIILREGKYNYYI